MADEMRAFTGHQALSTRLMLGYIFEMKLFTKKFFYEKIVCSILPFFWLSCFFLVHLFVLHDLEMIINYFKLCNEQLFLV